jgi:hypothetical protein
MSNMLGLNVHRDDIDDDLQRSLLEMELVKASKSKGDGLPIPKRETELVIGESDKLDHESDKFYSAHYDSTTNAFISCIDDFNRELSDAIAVLGNKPPFDNLRYVGMLQAKLDEMKGLAQELQYDATEELGVISHAVATKILGAVSAKYRTGTFRGKHLFDAFPSRGGNWYLLGREMGELVVSAKIIADTGGALITEELMGFFQQVYEFGTEKIQHDTSGDESYHALSLAKDMDTIASCCVVDVSEFTGSLCYRGVEGFDRLQASTSVDSVIKETENSTDEVGRELHGIFTYAAQRAKETLASECTVLEEGGLLRAGR